MTTSSSGLYGNFGQTNYRAATRMTEDIMSQEVLNTLVPEAVTTGAIVLCHENAPNRSILCAGGGGFSSSKIFETEGVWLLLNKCTPEDVIANWEAMKSYLLFHHRDEVTRSSIPVLYATDTHLIAIAALFTAFNLLPIHYLLIMSEPHTGHRVQALAYVIWLTVRITTIKR